MQAPWLRHPRTGNWLTKPVIAARARVLCIINLVLVVWAVVAMHPTAPDKTPTNVDFVSFYAAGALTDAGEPALAYNQAAHRQAETAATGPASNYLYFFYPPPYLLLCAVLAVMPYAVAFAAFELFGFLLFLPAIRGIAGPVERRLWLLPLFAFLPVFWGLGEGQNALLSAALLGGATLLIDKRPLTAGLLIGLLCYKPHLGLLIPVALAFGGHWRAIASAAGTVAALVLLSWALFGGDTWAAYIASLMSSGDAYNSGVVSYIGMVNSFGAARLAGLAVPTAIAIQGIVMAGCALCVAWIWYSSRSRAVRAATLLSATMAAAPLVLLYDQLLTFLAIIWLAREGSETGFLPWEKTILAIAFLLPTVGLPLVALGLPIAPLPALLLLALCGRRASGSFLKKRTKKLFLVGGDAQPVS